MVKTIKASQHQSFRSQGGTSGVLLSCFAILCGGLGVWGLELRVWRRHKTQPGQKRQK